MTYTFTYTLITHKWEIYKNNKDEIEFSEMNCDIDRLNWIKNE